MSDATASEQFSEGGVTVDLPLSVLSISKLEDVLTLDVWNSLDGKEKEELKAYLPQGRKNSRLYPGVSLKPRIL